MTDTADTHVRSPRTVEEAISLIAAGVAVIANGATITPGQNQRIAALADSLKERKSK